MPWVIGKKSDESLIEISDKKPDFDLAELQSVIPTNYGGISTDYSYYSITNQEVRRIHDGDSYVLTWVSNEITDVDFTIEDNKYWLHVSADDTYILNINNPSNSTDITFEMWDSDNTAIDTSVNTSGVRIPIGTPDGIRVIRVDFSSGQAVLEFYTSKSGEWTFPAIKQGYNTMKINNQVTVEVDDDDIF